IEYGSLPETTLIHTGGVTSSIPVAPTIPSPGCAWLRIAPPIILAYFAAMAISVIEYQLVRSLQE
ncbi:MAG: hypothetical protein WCP82_10890, partial [Alphaproteobacteria bacterium]